MADKQNFYSAEISGELLLSAASLSADYRSSPILSHKTRPDWKATWAQKLQGVCGISATNLRYSRNCSLSAGLF